MKPTIAYWTGSGNTQIIAEKIQETIESMGTLVECHYVSDISAEDIADADILFLGCPSMSGENVEEYEFRPFLDDLKPLIEGKKAVLFGSYDWGDQEWMVSWVEEMNEANIEVVKTLAYRWEPTEENLEEIEAAVIEIMKM